jgi:TonB family protein
MFMKFHRSLSSLVACVVLVTARAGEPAAANDTGFKIIRTVPLQYPIALMRDGVAHGEARVLINVNAEGRLTETLVLAYTHAPFAVAAVNAVNQWRYEPARLNGETVGTVADCSFRFDVDGILMVQRMGPPIYQKRDPFGENFAYKPYGLNALDGIPTPVRVISPIYPDDWVKQGLRGKVTIDFYIDETGAVRMPSVTSDAHPILAASAAAAVREWRFAPPLRKGRPVLVHCEQLFTFDRDPAHP